MGLPDDLVRILRRALNTTLPPPVTDPEGLPATPGAYILLAHLATPLPLSGRLVAGHVLPPGWLAYAGNARGPGGLRARLGCHLRPQKRPRWHIDQVTTQADALLALPFADTPATPAPTECALTANLVASGAFSPPVPGFGSSDCRTCTAHLLQWSGSDNIASQS